MAMRRTTLILSIVLAVVVVTAAVLYFMFPGKVNSVLNHNTNGATNTATTENTNTSTTPTNLSTSQVLSGDTTLTDKIKIGGVDVQFTSFGRVDTFNQTPADKGKEYVVIYFDGVDGAATNTVFSGLDTAQLVSGDLRFSRDVLKVAANIVKNDKGYIVFIVPTGTKNLTLEVGTGAALQSVKLP